MSKNKEIKILKPADIQKKILEKIPTPRTNEDLLGPLNKYRDELCERYNKKKKLFFEISKRYNRLNQETLICGKKRLLDDYRESLKCDALIDSDGEECKINCPCEKFSDDAGKFLRKRTERPIHQVKEPPRGTCCIEPWFKRYLMLRKFIWAARTVVLKNRLLKVLEKLKTVDADKIEALENRCQRRFLNVSYNQIFEKFM